MAADADVLQSQTTAEQDRKTKGQRHINLIWEATQAMIAVSVSISTLVVASMLAMKGQPEAALLLSNAFFLVIGFYFGRTNHQRTGGVGGDSASGGR